MDFARSEAIGLPNLRPFSSVPKWSQRLGATGLVSCTMTPLRGLLLTARAPWLGAGLAGGLATFCTGFSPCRRCDLRRVPGGRVRQGIHMPFIAGILQYDVISTRLFSGSCHLQPAFFKILSFIAGTFQDHGVCSRHLLRSSRT